MRETDRDLNSVENLDWNKIRDAFLKNTDPGGSHPIEDDLLPTYLRTRDLLFDAMREILFEVRVSRFSSASKDSLIFLSGYILGRAWQKADKKGPYGREKQLIKDMIVHYYEAFSRDLVDWKKDVSNNLINDFESGKLTFERLLYDRPHILAGFFTTLV